MERFIAAITLLLASSLTCAVEVAGVQIADTATLRDGSVLKLNGAGIRSKFFFKIYVGALYLAEPARTTEQVLAAEGGKRVLMHFLYDELPAEKLVNGWNDGFQSNLGGTEHQTLKPKIDAFNALFSDVNKGDEISIDMLPGTGTQVWYGKDLRGTVEGAEFNQALLKIWLGDKPADSSLKKAMLGGD